MTEQASLQSDTATLSCFFTVSYNISPLRDFVSIRLIAGRTGHARAARLPSASAAGGVHVFERTDRAAMSNGDRGRAPPEDSMSQERRDRAVRLEETAE